jgi:hypothetical protein
MKLVTFSHNDQERIGALDPIGRIVDLQKAFACLQRESGTIPDADEFAVAVLGRDMREFLEHGEKSLEAARKSLAHIAASEHVSKKCTVLQPNKIRLLAPAKIFPITSPKWLPKKALRLLWHF